VNPDSPVADPNLYINTLRLSSKLLVSIARSVGTSTLLLKYSYLLQTSDTFRSSSDKSNCHTSVHIQAAAHRPAITGAYQNKFALKNTFFCKNFPCNIYGFKIDILAAISQNKLYYSCQYMTHFSAVLTICRHSTYEWSVRPKLVAGVDKNNKICFG